MGLSTRKGFLSLAYSSILQSKHEVIFVRCKYTLWIQKSNLVLAGPNTQGGGGKCQLAGTWRLWDKLGLFANSPLAGRVTSQPWLADCVSGIIR